MADGGPIGRALRGQVEGPQQPQGNPTANLDALIARGIAGVAGTPEIQSATPLEGYPQLPDPNSGAAPPLYGEAPGEGYLYARAPAFRQAALVHTDPEIVRVMLLRAIETFASSAMLPFNQEGAQKHMDAALKAAQAYLLLDPEVDAEGVNVALRGAIDAANAAVGAAGQPSAGQPSSDGQAHGQVKPGKQVGGAQLPPRVGPGRAAQAVLAAHEHAREVLRGARPSRPLPGPRPGS